MTVHKTKNPKKIRFVSAWVGERSNEAPLRSERIEEKTENVTKNIFIICPVRGATEEEHNFLIEFIRKKEMEGVKVHYPPRDTNQDDPIGYAICAQNREAIKNADKIYVYWNSKSEGSLFDLGMAFAMKKRIVLINPSMVRSMVTKGKKSFSNVLLHLDETDTLETTSGEE